MSIPHAEDEGEGIFEKQSLKAGSDQCSARWHIELQNLVWCDYIAIKIIISMRVKATIKLQLPAFIEDIPHPGKMISNFIE